MEECSETVDEILKVPENAVKTDVLLYSYKQKRGKKKLIGNYLNFEVNVMLYHTESIQSILNDFNIDLSRSTEVIYHDAALPLMR